LDTYTVEKHDFANEMYEFENNFHQNKAKPVFLTTGNYVKRAEVCFGTPLHEQQ
jgi:hypothetical protein